MEWFEAVILGLIQGLTEFLPVSSSGHLVIAENLLGVDQKEDLVFEIMLHAATVLSTIVVFRKEIMELFGGLFKIKQQIADKRLNRETGYILKICVSMIPVLVVGMFFEDYIEQAFSNIVSVGIALLATAVLLFFSDIAAKRFQQEASPDKEITYWQAFIIGVAQAIATLPGLSRSGTTIGTGIICGVKKEKVAQFSFLMVLIPILGKAFLDLASGEITASTVPVWNLTLGFLAAFVSGLFACKVMIALVKKSQLRWFALYCLIVGITVLIF